MTTPNTVNYVTQFERELLQKYSRELMTAEMTTEHVRFINADTVKIPFIELAGYKDHSRNGGFNRQAVKNDFQTFVLKFDRDVEFFVDQMDVDESNNALIAANVTNEFETQQAIPETDCYRISKCYTEFKEHGGVPDTTALSNENILEVIDNAMMTMTEAEVPIEGRILYVTPTMEKNINEAKEIQRYISLNQNTGNVNRKIVNLDGLKIKPILSARMKTIYDFTDGCKAGANAKQINMILFHPKSLLACDKHQYIKLWPEGTHTQGDGYLYQNRKYGDLFVIPNRVQGVYINAEAEA
jgi:hypothetical protein